ncbi:unnamed protein product, partial [Vitis vinifera]|uniref:Cytochrome b561 domain-containing protein n=1 Tax=Vitis vinifera TaxID=29760 RepID=D7TVG6_VITVI
MINFNYICIQQLNDSIKKIIFLNIFFTFGLSLIRKLSVPCFTGHNSRVKRHRDLKASHGAMGLIAWGVLLPFGAIIPRYFKHHDPQWFYLHISIQIVGFLLGLATVLVGTILYSGLDSNRTPRLKIHRPIGSLAFFLSILQVMALILRPDKASKWRKYWNLYHHWAGRLALFLGGLNIVIGIWVAEAGSSWKITYGFFVTFILLTVAVLEASLGLGRSKKADAMIIPITVEITFFWMLISTNYEFFLIYFLLKWVTNLIFLLRRTSTSMRR